MMAVYGLGSKNGLFCHKLHTASVPHVTVVLAAMKPGHPVPRLPHSTSPPSTRLIAVQQLLRIEEEGAYAGLVNGSATASISTSGGPSSFQSVKVTEQGSDDDENESADVMPLRKSMFVPNKSSKYVCIQNA